MSLKPIRELFHDTIVAAHNLISHRTGCEFFKSRRPCLTCQLLNTKHERSLAHYYSSCGVPVRRTGGGAT